MANADWLKDHEQYRDLTYDDTRYLGEYGVEQIIKKGMPIIEEGDTLNPGAGFIKSGSAKVAMKVKNVEKVLAFFRAGDFFGEMTLVQPTQPRSATIVAAADTTILTLPYAQYERLKREKPMSVFRLLEIFLRITGSRLRETNKRIA